MEIALSVGGRLRRLAMVGGLAASLLALVACGLGPSTPRPGLRDFEREAVQVLGDVRVHLAGGNVSTDRVDLVLDTRVGPLAHGAVFNSATGAWLWRHEMRLQGGVFVDASGAELELGAVADGAAIPGTHWVKLDAVSVRTKGGLVHVFDAVDGRLVEVRWADGAYPSLRYVGETVAGGVRIVRVEQCLAADDCSEQLTLSYDASGCVASAADRAGRVAEYEHDAACLTRVARDAFDAERGLSGRRYEYGGAGRLRAIVSSEGERTELDYLGGRIDVVRGVGAGDPEHRFAYAADVTGTGATTRMTTPSGGVWAWAFDEARRLVRRESPEGVVVEQTWAGLRPQTRTDASGGVWRFEHEDDDLTRLERPSGAVVRRVFAPGAVERSRPFARPVERVVDGLGVREQRVYDAAGRLATLVNGANESTTFTWDGLGQLATITGPDGRVASFHDYGEHGHATRAVKAGVEEIRLFDAVGNLEKGAGLDGELAPGRPGLVRRVFDADRNVAEVWTVETDLLDGTIVTKTTVIERRSDGRPVRIDRPYGGVEAFAYDALGRLVSRSERVDGVDRWTTIDVDLEGRPIRVERPNGMRATFAWDLDGRLESVERALAGAPSERLELTHSDDRVVRVDDAAYEHPEWIEYDADGRVRAIDHATGGRTVLQHDVRGRETRRSVFEGVYGSLLYETTRAWDGAGRSMATRLDGELLVEHSWADGELREQRFGNGLVRTFEYGAETGELERTRTILDGTQPIEHTTVVRLPCWLDKLCFAVSSSVLLAGPEGGAPVWNLGEEHYQLEWHPSAYGESPTPGSWLRLSSHMPILDVPEGDRVRFDALGNLAGYQSRTGPAVSFEYNAERNRLLSGGFGAIHDFVHDESGFVTERDDVQLRWTASGRIASIGADARFEWDVRGRPVARTFGDETTRYGYGGTTEIDDQGWPVATEIDGVRVVLGTAIRRYAHHDFRGNVSFVTDESGRALRRHVYHGFGERRVVGRDGAQRAPRDGERGFARGVHVAGIQLVGVRPYDPDTGRFMAPDPIDHLLNDFAYTRGNPVRLWDPGGMHSTRAPSGETISPAGEATVAIGEGFMTFGAAMAGGGVAVGGPPGAAAIASGVVSFFIGVTLTIVGKGMTEPVEPIDPHGHPHPPDAAEFHKPDVKPGSSPLCAPDGLTPRGSRPGPVVATCILVALVAWVGSVRRAPR